MSGEDMGVAPKADKMASSFEIHGVKYQDDYAWLRDPKWPDVSDVKILSYLTEENLYAQKFFKPLAAAKEALFEELKGKIQLKDQTPYDKLDEYYYYSRTEADKEYPIYCRKKGSKEAAEEVILDENELAKGHKFMAIGGMSVSPDHKLLAYSVDFEGGERFTAKVYDLEKKQYLPDELTETIDDLVWHETIPGFFYAKINENWQPDKIYFHQLGTKQSEDKLIIEEKNPLYRLSIYKSSSLEYIIINSSGHSDSEISLISVKDQEFKPVTFKKRQDEIIYDVDHMAGYFYIRTNDQAKDDFRLTRVLEKDFAIAEWKNYINAVKGEYLQSFALSQNYLVANYQVKGLPLIRVVELKSGHEKKITFDKEPSIARGTISSIKDDHLRIYQSSFARPRTIYDYNFVSNKLAVLKVTEIPAGFNQEDYKVERIFAEHDGVKVPVTLVYKKSLFKQDGTNPLYLYGYGSYGMGMPVHFRINPIVLADRGFVFAIAHIRGGDELGYDWYKSAKMLTKKKTFQDFIAASEALIAKKYTSKGNIVVSGGSAGGLLIGNVINERPELFKAAIAHVPFVDVINSMLDETLPLTVTEFNEWGNPKEREYFEYMYSYSPYDNVKAQDYPAMFITAGLTDPRVGYWEPAKFVAKLRAMKTDKNLLLLKTNMEAGHGGATGRFDYLKEEAEELLFVFEQFKP